MEDDDDQDLLLSDSFFSDNEREELNSRLHFGQYPAAFVSVQIAKVTAIPSQMATVSVENESFDFLKRISKSAAVIDSTRKKALVTVNLEGLPEMFNLDLKAKIQVYINTFRKTLAAHLHDDVGQEFTVIGFPSGVLLNINQAKSLANNDIYLGNVKSISDAYNAAGRQPWDYFEGKELEEYVNAMIKNERITDKKELYIGDGILMIASDNEKFWSADIAKKDAQKIIDFIETKPKM